MLHISFIRWWIQTDAPTVFRASSPTPEKHEHFDQFEDMLIDFPYLNLVHFVIFRNSWTTYGPSPLTS